MKSRSRLVLTVDRGTAVFVGEGEAAIRITTSSNIEGIWPQNVRLNIELPRDLNVLREPKSTDELSLQRREWHHRRKR